MASRHGVAHAVCERRNAKADQVGGLRAWGQCLGEGRREWVCGRDLWSGVNPTCRLLRN
jgi:hypothetical protein